MVSMASILVVGQEQRSLERFHRVLSAEGWRVRVAQGRAQALQAAALEPPDLVLTGAEMPGAEELASAFRRSAGGPGIVVVMSEVGSPTGPAVLGDDRLRQPFGDQDLVAAVRRRLSARRDPTGPQALMAPLPPTVRLTSQEIFGDVLAEVEGFGQPGTGAGAAPAGTAPAAGSAGAAGRMAAAEPAGTGAAASPARSFPGSPGTPEAPGARGTTEPAAAAAGVAAAPHPSRPAFDDDVQRKLEQTLSGVFGGDLRLARMAASPSASSSASPPHSSRRSDHGGGAAEIEAMLSKTLSDLGARPRPVAAPLAARAAPAPVAARPAAVAPPASPPKTEAGGPASPPAPPASVATPAFAAAAAAAAPASPPAKAPLAPAGHVAAGGVVGAAAVAGCRGGCPARAGVRCGRGARGGRVTRNRGSTRDSGSIRDASSIRDSGSI